MKEAERVAFSLLHEAGLDTSHIENSAAYKMMLENGLNCPKASSMGRLFDGVSAILGIKQKCSYEGQAAILLEAAAEEDEGLYPISFTEDMRFDWRGMICSIVEDMRSGESTGRIAAKFMNTVMEMAVLQCRAARDYSGLSTVCLSGGSFQNMYIIHRLPEKLEAEGFRVLKHRRVSTNDEGLSLGQLMIANAKL